MFKNYPEGTFTDKDGNAQIFGVWYNFGSNVSWMRRGPNSYRLKNDDTGETITPSGPAGRDAIAGALYHQRDNRTYAHYNFGARFHPKED